MSGADPNMDEAKTNQEEIKEETPETEDTPKPEDAKKEKEEKEKDPNFSYFEPVTGIIFAIVCAVVFLVFPQIITIVFVGDTLIPTFDDEVIRNIWYLVVIWGLLHIGVDVVYLVQRKYSQNFVKFSIIGHAVAAIVACFILIPYKIVNVEYIDFIHRYYADIAEWFGNILVRPNLIVLVVMIVIFIIESITVMRRGKRTKETDEENKRKKEELAAKAEANEENKVNETNEVSV